MRRIHVQNISVISIAVTIILSIACVAIFTQGRVQFETLQQATETYISCEKDAKQLQSGSDYLTEQVRMVVMTGDDQYIDNYFTEADETQRREQALGDLKGQFSGANAFNSLQQAMNESTELMQTEYYAMRLMCDANGKSDAVAKQRTTVRTRRTKPRKCSSRTGPSTMRSPTCSTAARMTSC